ncbi:MAG: LysR family transcriptional regulator [Gemmatimonadaceae bacterium]
MQLPAMRAAAQIRPMSTVALNALNYQHLLYFWVVAREGSIVRATALLHLTQPTISSQLKTLEASLGSRLFARRGRGLVLTETGQLVFRYADEMFRTGRELTEALSRGHGDVPSRLVVGVSDSLPKLTTWRLLQPALAVSPGFRLTCRIDKLDRLVADLAVHALDVVLADTPASPSLPVRVFNHLLGECGVTVFATPELATKYRRRFPQSLHEAPFVLQTENTAIRRAFDAWCIANDIRPHIVCESEDAALLQVFGQESMGLFLAPTVVEARIRKHYGVRVVGRLPTVTERFYAISVERRLAHPGVVALSVAARTRLFH